MTAKATYTERQQADELARIEGVLKRMAYSKNANGFRYEAWEEIAMAWSHVRYAIDELKRLRCTDGKGLASHDYFADSCTRCGQGLE